MARDFVPYNFTSGRYRAKLRTTYTDAFLVQKNKESDPYEFTSETPGPTSRGKWIEKTWNGLSNFYGIDIWTDGTNIYYSHSDTQYVLNRETDTWIEKTWYGYLMRRGGFGGSDIWTDGTNIYYSSGSWQYVLNQETDTWTEKEWNGLSYFYGADVWTDGTNIYYSTYDDGGANLILDKATSTWSEISITEDVYGDEFHFYGAYTWTDGTNIYIADINGSDAYAFNKNTRIATLKQNWRDSEANFSCVWNDGNNIYASNGNDSQKYYDRDTDSWEDQEWVGEDEIYSYGIWKDGDHVYYSYSTIGNYELVANE
jgi:hypothetical protein